jgi:hypothetical protein
MAGYLVHDGRASYLERTPYDNSYSWLASQAMPAYATVFTKDAAELMVEHKRSQGEVLAHVRADPEHRDPEIGVDAIRHLVARTDAA